MTPNHRIFRPHFFKNMCNFFNTIKYLRPKQIYFRLYYRFHKISPYNCKNELITKRDTLKPWFFPGLFHSTLTQSEEISFLGKTVSIRNQDVWNKSEHSKLWLYNLHYFNELNTVDAHEYAELFNRFIDRWVNENPLFKGMGWEPYPLSLRIVNLIKWYSKDDHYLTSEKLESLWTQVYALSNQIEHHILGNHLLANAKALVFAGAYFHGNRAETWLKKGLRILDQEIKEQFLSDGGHFELSPMYHSLLLWDLCDLVCLADNTKLEELNRRRMGWQKRIEQGYQWLSVMCHPDNNISFFNDAAFGIAPTLLEIKNYIEYLNIPIKDQNNKFSLSWLKDSGYCIVNLGNASKAIVDIGKIGPDYQPGHAHADTLSFELSLYGQRFLVNSGTSEYGEGIVRQYQRGTKAHNTVCIDNLDSSEVWAGFRVARRAYPQKTTVQNDELGTISIECAHNGYLRLPGKNTHQRKWIFNKNSLFIHDNITGPCKKAEARFYFHPNIRLQLNGEELLCGLCDGKTVTVKIIDAVEIGLEKASWHPNFGSAIENYCLVVLFNHQLVTQITW